MFLVPQTCIERHEVREIAQPPEPPPDGDPALGAVMWLCVPGHDRGAMLPSPARWHHVHCGVGHEHHSSMEAILSAFLPCQRLRAAPCEFHEGQVCPHRFRPLASSFRT